MGRFRNNHRIAKVWSAVGRNRAVSVDPSWWTTSSFEGRPLAAALADHDIGLIFRFLRTRGISRARIAMLTGISETRVRQVAQGRQRVTSYEVLERIANGLRIPRQSLGLGNADNADPKADGGSSTPADPLVRESWDDLLTLLITLSNASGCAMVRRPVEGQLRLISAARRSASGPEALRLLAAEAKWTEFLSWTEANGRRPAHAHPLLDRAHDMAVEAQDRHLTAYILMRKSQQLLDDGDATRAVATAQQAQRLDALPSRIAALCLAREAEGHALSGDTHLCQEKIAAALRLDSGLSGPRDPLSKHCTTVYLRAVEARCRQLLGDSEASVKIFEEILRNPPESNRLDEGIWRVGLATAYLDEDRPDQAGSEVLLALQNVAKTSSARTVRAAGTLLPRLRRHHDLDILPAVTDAYRTALAACDH